MRRRTTSVLDTAITVGGVALVLAYPAGLVYQALAPGGGSVLTRMASSDALWLLVLVVGLLWVADAVSGP